MNTNSNGDALLSAYALREVSDSEQAAVERDLATDPHARQTVDEVTRLAAAVFEARGGTPSAEPSKALQAAVVARLDEVEGSMLQLAVARPAERRWRRYMAWGVGGLALTLAGCVVGVSIATYSTHLNWNERATRLLGLREQSEKARSSEKSKVAQRSRSDQSEAAADFANVRAASEKQARSRDANELSIATNPLSVAPTAHDVHVAATEVQLPSFGERTATRNDLTQRVGQFPGSGLEGRASSTVRVMVTGAGGRPVGNSPDGRDIITTGDEATIRIWREGQKGELGDLIKTKEGGFQYISGGEQYDAIVENPFLPVDKATALSTFSIDVDTASYANVRRFLSQNQLPPPNAVRIEEMLNYFSYSYPQPKGEDPFSVNMELADCPWQPGHQLLRIGLKGRDVHVKERKPGNLVFLVDVSGSMQPENKLPLLKQAFKMLAGELTENDKVTIVTYAGDAGLKLDATNGTNQAAIRGAIDSLQAGGSTHGSAGIELAYQKAAQSFIKDGTNRVILATDGDLNVGVTSDEALVHLIKTKAASGVFLTVLGVGEGNLKDSKMEKLADSGNGVYAYLDNLREARKVLVEQLSGSLETIAKDVKLQIEFNPAEVAAYRLIGYENRVLAERDFNDDKKDAGEIGAGHTVTALYELVPARARAEKAEVKTPDGSPLKYQRGPEPPKVAPEALTPAAATGEVLTLKLRFKEPTGETSKLREYPLKSEGGRFSRASADMQFAAAVASFGMLLRGSQHRGDATFSAVEEIASSAIGPDAGGYRAEFLDLVRKAKMLNK